jgi:hypothetical protein
MIAASDMTGIDSHNLTEVNAVTSADIPLTIKGPELQAMTPTKQAASAHSWE